MNGTGVIRVVQDLPDTYADCREGDAILQYFDDVPQKEVRWLWHNRIALGKLTMIAGDPGLGKSFITLDWAARISRNLPWPDGAPGIRGSVIILSAEDDNSDTIKPRLIAAGANVSNIASLRAVMRFDEEHQFSLERDLPALEDAIEAVPECRMIVIDPITAYCGSTDSHKNAEIRSLLAPLAELASRHRVAIVCVSHLNKGQGSAIYRTMGSLAFVAAARAAYVVAKDRHDPQRRLFLPIKNNLGDDVTGFAYRLVDGRVEWEEGLISVTADDALDRDDNRPKGPKVNDDLERAKSWLRDQVFEGKTAVPASEVEEWAKGEGVSAWHLQRAKKDLGIESKRQGGVWHWTIQESGDTPTPISP